MEIDPGTGILAWGWDMFQLCGQTRRTHKTSQSILLFRPRWYCMGVAVNPRIPNEVKLSTQLHLAAELNYGITSFDNIAVSLLTVFQCITM